jgi:succinate dehydrogenase / fumarate reductase flavoprotein subunit/fumarate reductase (CoM/CoB) subunit A
MLLGELREAMGTEVGPFRTEAGLARAVARLAELRAGLGEAAIAPGLAFNPTVADWFELHASLLAAEAVAQAALAREESRGAHQRADFPKTDPAWARPQYVRMTRGGTLEVGSAR